MGTFVAVRVGGFDGVDFSGVAGEYFPDVNVVFSFTFGRLAVWSEVSGWF